MDMNEQSIPETQPVKKNSFLPLIISLFIVVVAAGAGYFLLKNKKQESSEVAGIRSITVQSFHVDDSRIGSDEGFDFPLFVSPEPGDQKVVEKLNTELQTKVLGTILADPLWKNKYLSDTDHWMRYQGQLVAPTIIQLGIESGSCGANCSAGTDYYTVDIQDGRILSLADLFTPQGISTLQKELTAYKNETITDFLTALDNDPNYADFSEEEINIQLEYYRTCLDQTSVPDFYFTSITFTLEESHCIFPHVYQALDDLGNFSLTKNIADMQPFLTEYGKKVFSKKIEDASNNAATDTLIKNFYTFYFKQLKQNKSFSNIDRQKLGEYISSGFIEKVFKEVEMEADPFILAQDIHGDWKEPTIFHLSAAEYAAQGSQPHPIVCFGERGSVEEDSLHCLDVYVENQNGTLKITNIERDMAIWFEDDI